MTNTTRLLRLERARPVPTPGGGAIHTDAEHIAAVWTALEDAGVIRFPDELPDDERADDLIRQLEAWRLRPEVLT